MKQTNEQEEDEETLPELASRARPKERRERKKLS
jgi:hypothetical protein